MSEVTINITEEPIEVTINVYENAKGLPSGGSVGQLLSKASGANYHTIWIDPPSTTVGLSEVAFGDPVTGEIISDPYIKILRNISGFADRNSMSIAGMLLSNHGGNTSTIVTNESFYIQSGFEASIFSNASYYVNLNNKVFAYADRTFIYGGTVSTDNGIRVDANGVRVGPYSTLNTANVYPFEVTSDAGNRSLIVHNVSFRTYLEAPSHILSISGQHLEFSATNALGEISISAAIRTTFLSQVKISSAGAPLIVNSTNNNGGKLAFFDSDVLVSYFGGAGSQPAVWYMPNGDEILSSDANRKLTIQKLKIANCPTSPAGLTSGDIWSDGGILKMV